MGIQDLQTYLENNVAAASVPVDLFKVARTVNNQRRVARMGPAAMIPTTLCLAVDGESCLDRLYGGFFSDWVCGGQWNRMVEFLNTLVQSIQRSDIELAIFFNGASEKDRLTQWAENQIRTRRNINQILRHIYNRRTPPPKAMWIPPSLLRTSLRLALRQLNVAVLLTVDDHHHEVISFCRENLLHGVVAQDGEYAIFDPNRYFSAQNLKLTYKGSLETKEYILDEVARALDLNPNRFCLLAALLGNHLLTPGELAPFHRSVCTKNPTGPIPSEALVLGVAEFLRQLPSIDDLDALGTQIFHNSNDKRIEHLKKSVQYYTDGTKEGFLRACTIGRLEQAASLSKSKSGHFGLKESSKFASEAPDAVKEGLDASRKATVGASGSGDSSGIDGGSGFDNTAAIQEKVVNGSPSASAAKPAKSKPSKAKKVKDLSKYVPPAPPKLPAEVLNTAKDRHQKGLMSPLIYQVLTQGEIKLPVLLEDDMHSEMPSIHYLYMPIRQAVYSILFNLHHHRFMANQAREKEDAEPYVVPEIIIKEWIWSLDNPYKRPELVRAEPLNWGVPTVQRLWFGSVIEDKRRRLRAFLTCLRSETALMLNSEYVPQQIIILACVLRYIMTFEDRPILFRHELDAFIAQAFLMELRDAQYLQDLQLEAITPRGVQLATLFTEGVEVALFANDACGSPIPWPMCCPWLFFDGKLFQAKLLRAGNVKNLMELCDHNIETVLKVERVRKAILDGINPRFAQMQFMGPPQGFHPRMNGVFPNSMPAGYPLGPVGRGRGLLATPPRSGNIMARGGQLEIGGVVVGSWGPNFGNNSIKGRGYNVPPQVMSVGTNNNYPGSNYGSLSGMRVTGRPTYPTRSVARKAPLPKKKPISASKSDISTGKAASMGRGLAVAGENGDVVPGGLPAVNGFVTNGNRSQFEDALSTAPSALKLETKLGNTSGALSNHI